MSTCKARRERGKRRGERKKKGAGSGVVNKSLVTSIGLGPTMTRFGYCYSAGVRSSFFFFTWWSKSQGYFCETKLFLEKGWPTRGHGQMARPGELTARFFFLFFPFSIIFYVHASSFKDLKFCFQSDTYGFC